MKNIKKILSLMLSIALVIIILPTTANAASSFSLTKSSTERYAERNYNFSFSSPKSGVAYTVVMETGTKLTASNDLNWFKDNGGKKYVSSDHINEVRTYPSIVPEALANKSSLTVYTILESEDGSGCSNILETHLNGWKDGAEVISTPSKSTNSAVTLKLNASKAAIGVGETYTLKPTTNSSKTITWSSSDKSVAAVKNGKITAKSTGTATITAKVDGKTAKAVITVKKAPTKVTAKDVTVEKGKTASAVLSFPSGSVSKSNTFVSSDKSIATVNKTTGKITGVKAGSCTITVTTYNKKTTKIKVTVIDKGAQAKKSNGSMTLGEAIAAAGVSIPAGANFIDFNMKNYIVIIAPKDNGVQNVEIFGFEGKTYVVGAFIKVYDDADKVKEFSWDYIGNVSYNVMKVNIPNGRDNLISQVDDWRSEGKTVYVGEV